MTTAATKIPALMTPVAAAALLMTVASTATAGTTKEIWNRPAGPDNTSQVTAVAGCSRGSSSAVACWNDRERDSLTQANDERTDTDGDYAGDTEGGGDGGSDIGGVNNGGGDTGRGGSGNGNGNQPNPGNGGGNALGGGPGGGNGGANNGRGGGASNGAGVNF